MVAHEALQLRADHPAVLVRGYADAEVGAKTADASAGLHGIVALKGTQLFRS